VCVCVCVCVCLYVCLFARVHACTYVHPLLSVARDAIPQAQSTRGSEVALKGLHCNVPKSRMPVFLSSFERESFQLSIALFFPLSLAPGPSRSWESHLR